MSIKVPGRLSPNKIVSILIQVVLSQFVKFYMQYIMISIRWSIRLAVTAWVRIGSCSSIEPDNEPSKQIDIRRITTFTIFTYWKAETLPSSFRADTAKEDILVTIEFGSDLDIRKCRKWVENRKINRPWKSKTTLMCMIYKHNSTSGFAPSSAHLSPNTNPTLCPIKSVNLPESEVDW